MSVKLNKSVHPAPFFPPGIAHHKNISTLSNDGKKPQNVKECKMLSKNKDNIMSTSLVNSNDRRNNLRRFSNSTPNLKVCRINNQDTSIHKQTCDMGLSNHMDFKASPLPSYYNSEPMTRSYTNYSHTTDRIKTRSLDRLSSSNKSRNLTGFVPDKPFYPPSQYPNIHDKGDSNIQRLLETRDKYKTPESRKSTHKIARRQSLCNLRERNKEVQTMQNEKNDINKSHQYGSVPNLQKKPKTVISDDKQTLKKKEKVEPKVNSNMKPINKTEIVSNKSINLKGKENLKEKENLKVKKSLNRKENLKGKENLKENENLKVKESLNGKENLKRKENSKTNLKIMKNSKVGLNQNEKSFSILNKLNKDCNEIQFGNNKEIGLYRQSNRLDLQASDENDKNKSNQMTTSYFYPKPIPNQRIHNSNDRMVQSLIFERSVASMIYTGSLDRANRNYQLPTEFTDVDESPTKSISVPKRLNSFSQDSLDGNKSKKKPKTNMNYTKDMMYEELNNDDISLNSELEQSSTISQIDEDELKTPCTHHSGMHSNTSYLMKNYWDSIPIKDDVDQYNIDQLMKPSVSMKDLSSFSKSGRSSPISIHNEFISNQEHSIIGKDDQTLLNDLASKCIVCTDRNHVEIIITNNNNARHSESYKANVEKYSSGLDDRKVLNNIASKSILSIDPNYEKLLIAGNENFTKISQLNSPYELEKEEFIIPIERFENEEACYKKFESIKPLHSLNKESQLKESSYSRNVNDDIPRVILGGNLLRNFKEFDIEKSNFKRPENTWIDDNVSSKIKKDHDYDEVLVTNDNFTNVQRIRSPGYYEENEENLNNHPKKLQSNNARNIWDETGNNAHSKDRLRSEKNGSLNFDQNLCEIIMTDENLTGIKDPHNHSYSNDLMESKNPLILDDECSHLNNCSHFKNDVNENVTKVESNKMFAILPNKPYKTESLQIKKENKNVPNNDILIFDKNGDRILITYDNLTGIKHVENQNEFDMLHEQMGYTVPKNDNKNIMMGSDQFCDQIFISGNNFGKVHRVLSPIDGEYSMVKDILFNDPTLNLNGTRYYFNQNISRKPLPNESFQNEYPINENKSYNRPSFLDSLNAQHNEDDYNHNNKNMPLYNNKNGTMPSIKIERDVSESSSINESWSDYEENRSCRDYMDNSVAIHRNGIPWVSSPEINSAHYSFTGNSGRHLQSENPLKPLCSVCHMPAYFMERISVSNIIFHKSCFRCRKCDTHLNFDNCIIFHNRPYCCVHMRSKIRRSVRSASSKKLDHIKEKLDNKSNVQKQTPMEVKQQKRIFYEGMNSAKTKFLDDATKVKEIPIREPKRITPPREGFNSGIIESEPSPRDPNIIAHTDNQSKYFDEINLLTQNNSTKETRARFKELQNKSNGSKDIEDEDETVLSKRKDVIPVDTKSLRNKFTVGANDSNVKVTKINPSDEIRRLSKQETNSIYENESESNVDNINKNSQKEDETVSPISRTRAKEMKERFTNFAQNDKPKKSEMVKLEYGEGGIYESNPQEKLDDVVKYNYDTTIQLPENTVKSGLQRIKELQEEKSQGYQKTNKEPFIIETDNSQSGIYENTPEQSRADSISNQNNGSLLEFKEKNYANEAKKILLEKQKQENEGSLKKSPPHMIDIWKDLCPDSGIFENQPKEQRKDVVKHDDSKYELVVQNDSTNINGGEVISADKNEEHNLQEAALS